VGFGGGGGGFGGGGGGGYSGFGGNGGFGGGGGGGGGSAGSGGFGGGNADASGGGGGAGLGGAIFNMFGSATLVNCTLFNNAAVGGSPGNGTAQGGSAFGGGIFNLDGTVALTNCTLDANTLTGGTSGAAICDLAFGNSLTGAAEQATVSSSNSIYYSPGFHELFVDQAKGAHTNSATINGSGPNMMGAVGSFTGGGIYTGTAFTIANPQLGTLANNGGTTQTMLPGNPAALGTGNAAAVGGIAFDQRGLGFLRVVNGQVDLGAVEVHQPARPGAFRSSTGQWFLDAVEGSYTPATTEQIDNFGAPGDIAVKGDWLGDGQVRIGVFRPSSGQWFLSKTDTSYTPANTIQIDNFGTVGDIPVAGHFVLGDSRDFIGVFRPSTGEWFLDQVENSYNPATTKQINNFGTVGDVPVVGNWGGSSIITDSRSYVGVFRPSTGQWFLDEVEGSYSPGTTLQIDNFGQAGDTAAVGNWAGGAGNGHTYVGVFRPGTHQWFLSTSNTNYAPTNTLQIDNFGQPGDVAEVGDWLGNGLTRVGVFRPGTHQWFLSLTNTNYTPSNTIQIDNFGSPGDQAEAGIWQFG
jgi:hypothetical protein